MTPTTTEQNKRIVRRLPEEVANQDNVDALDEIFAEDFLDHTPLGEMDRGATKEQFEQLLAAFPDRTVTVENLLAERDTVVIRVTWNATHEGEYLGIEPTGREVEFSVMEFHRLDDGKIAERWIQPDQLGLMEQLGVVEPPGE